MEKILSGQSKLIGEHPNKSLFVEWLKYEDIPPTEKKLHRNLISINEMRGAAVEVISEWIIKHHISDQRINRIKKRRNTIIDKYGLEKYLSSQQLLPIDKKTMKGNGTEIILSEYLQESSAFDSLIYRLRYNPNVNQSMKGDDVLLFNIEDLKDKIILGESKFRKRPSKAAVEEITNDFGKKLKLPLSIVFVAERVSELGNEELAVELEELNLDVMQENVRVINVGFLLSNQNTLANVERNLVSENDNFLFLSLGIEEPDEFISECFGRANEKLKEGHLI